MRRILRNPDNTSGLDFSEEDIAELVDGFDANGDGQIDMKEWVRSFEKQHQLEMEQQLQQQEPAPAALSQEITRSANGKMDPMAIVREIESYCDAKKLRLRDAFKVFDRNGDGHISAREMQQCLQLLGVPLSASDTVALLRFLDTDGNGSVDVQEYEKAVRDLRRKEAQEGKREKRGKNGKPSSASSPRQPSVSGAYHGSTGIDNVYLYLFIDNVYPLLASIYR
jgi:Ca2+-binding EF-hand superfamily protein